MESGMTARRVALLAAIVTMGAAGWYVFLYLARWEWNRAVVAGVIFLAAEIALVGSLVLDRLAKIQRVLPTAEPIMSRRSGQPEERSEHGNPDPRVLARLNGSAPPPREPFAWLRREPDQLSVFVPILLGAGVMLSGLAWIVERVARFTAGPTIERVLAKRLETLSLPPGGLLGNNDQTQDLFSPTV
jgi:hypothetical protein